MKIIRKVKCKLTGSKARNSFKSYMLLLLAAFMIFGSLPQEMLAGTVTKEEPVYIDGIRVRNLRPTQPSRLRTPHPNVTHVGYIPTTFAADATVNMNGSRVWARRYVVYIDGIAYEAYCADRATRSSTTSA